MRAQALADRFAALLFYVAVGAAIVTFICGRCWATWMTRSPTP
jgi:hypothetical protein